MNKGPHCPRTRRAAPQCGQRLMSMSNTIAAQEAGAGATVLVGYLVGLGLLQYGLARLAGFVVHTLLKATEAKHMHARL